MEHMAWVCFAATAKPARRVPGHTRRGMVGTFIAALTPRTRRQHDLPMSTTGRRIITAKTMALAILAIVFAVVALWHRRRPDARTAEHRSHSPLVRPSW
jgi:hypothetical protein